MDGIILVKKPSGITSHDLVQRARRKLQTSKIGHTGTLDPLANGLMILTIGKSTKILPFLAHYTKEYICTMKLGLRSDTLDSTGEILQTQAINPFTQDDLQKALKSLLGTSMQTPPMYSAKKINGQHCYDLARNNIEVKREPVEITISDIELLNYCDDTIQFRVVCSNGTYVRVLTQDIANHLNNIAVMTVLTRTKIDKFHLEDAYEIDELDENVKVVQTYDILTHYTYIERDDLSDVYNGKRIKIDSEEQIVMITHNKEVIAAYEKGNDGYYYNKRGLW